MKFLRKNLRVAFLTLVGITILMSYSDDYEDGNLTNVQILTDFYNSMNGNNWINNSNWLVDPDPCNWFGVTCVSGEVTELNLNNNDLQGTFSPLNDLCGLPFLEELDLSNNSIDGEIPACLFTATRNVYLNNNLLSGEIPESFKNVTLASDFNISNNNLEGCYSNSFAPLCFFQFSNSMISLGNNLEGEWEDYCADGSGVCCENSYSVDLNTIESGTYYAGREIKLDGNLSSSKNVTLRAKQTIVDSPNGSSNFGNITIDPNGCNDRNSLHFDGDNDYLQTNGYVTLPNFSVSIWYKGDDYLGIFEGRIFSIIGVNAKQLSIGFFPTPPFNLWYNHPTGGVGQLPHTVLDDQWHFIVFTASPEGDKLYFDGQLVNDFPANPDGFDTYFRIGRWISGGDITHVLGNIDEFRMYNITLDESDVADQYNCNEYNHEANVDIYYNFDDGLAFDDNTGLMEIVNQQGNTSYNATIIDFSLVDSVSNFVNPLEVTIDDCCDATFTTQCLKVFADLDQSTGEVQLDASQFDAGTTLSCTDPFSISFDTAGLITSRTFTCDDEGLNDVSIYYLSDGGILDSCAAMVLINDVFNVCP